MNILQIIRSGEVDLFHKDLKYLTPKRLVVLEVEKVDTKWVGCTVLTKAKYQYLKMLYELIVYMHNVHLLKVSEKVLVVVGMCSLALVIF